MPTERIVMKTNVERYKAKGYRLSGKPVPKRYDAKRQVMMEKPDPPKKPTPKAPKPNAEQKPEQKPSAQDHSSR